MELTDSLKTLFIDTAKTLKGSARRVFMARTVKELGTGGQRRAERELGWSRVTIRKGTRELESVCRFRTTSPRAAGSGQKPICPISSPISRPLSIAKVKPTPSSAAAACIRA